VRHIEAPLTSQLSNDLWLVVRSEPQASKCHQRRAVTKSDAAFQFSLIRLAAPRSTEQHMTMVAICNSRISALEHEPWRAPLSNSTAARSGCAAAVTPSLAVADLLGRIVGFQLA
jgi:hypothetical protein